MSEKPISPLRQRMIEDTPAAGRFISSKLWIIQPVPLLTTEFVRSAGSQQLFSTLHSSRIRMTEFAAGCAKPWSRSGGI